MSASDFVVERGTQGWTVRVPVRREAITLEKRTVVAERVLIRRQLTRDVEQVDVGVRREELRVRERGATGAVSDHPERIAPVSPHDTLAGTGMDQDPAH